jgi:PhzF family phenazine biosynthesis protein
MRRAYRVVDAFSSRALRGNPVAVVLDAEGLDDAAMQAIACWTNLSETTFLLPPSDPRADYRLRIFDPVAELPFAGHPTLGSAHAALEAGRARPRGGVLVQECGVGLVEVAVSGEGADRRLTLTLPPATVRDVAAEDVHELEAVLGTRIVREALPAVVDVGAVWIVAQVPSLHALLAIAPDLPRMAALERRLGATGVSVFARPGHGAEVEVRSFAPSAGIPEDPVCGSGNGCVAVFRSRRGLLPAGARYVASQGRCVGRDGLVSVEVAGGTVKVGGSCVTVVEGTIDV